MPKEGTQLYHRRNLIYGVSVNDADYRLRKEILIEYKNGKQKYGIIWVCPFLKCWQQMLQRCYSDKYKKQQPSYVGCSVCEEWLTFSNFKRWMEQQDYEGKALDKDLLVSQKIKHIVQKLVCLFPDILIISCCNLKQEEVNIL